jgi:tRNA threonylcarbamoyladenosine biosynthesis protein TsaB
VEQKVILCIETSGAATSAALCSTGECIAVKEIAEVNKAADKLHVLVEALLKEQRVNFSALSAVAVSSGPGSFTGLRIAAAAAKGFCFSLDIPLLAVPTFEAMTYGAISRYGAKADFYVPALDARRMEIYTAVYNEEAVLQKYFESVVLDASFSEHFGEGNYVMFGSGAEKARSFTGPLFSVLDGFIPSAADLCVPAWKRFKKEEFADLVYFEPDYAKPFYTAKSQYKSFNI